MSDLSIHLYGNPIRPLKEAMLEQQTLLHRVKLIVGHLKPTAHEPDSKITPFPAVFRLPSMLAKQEQRAMIIPLQIPQEPEKSAVPVASAQQP